MVERFRAEPVPRRRDFQSDGDFFEGLSDYVQNHFTRMEDINEARDRASRYPYAMTNVTTLRTLDGAAGTLSDVRSVLATLITDLGQKAVVKTRM